MKSPGPSLGRSLTILAAIAILVVAAKSLHQPMFAQGSAPLGDERSVGVAVSFTPESSSVPRYGMFQVNITVANPPAGNPFRNRHVIGEFTHVETGETTHVEGYCDSQDGSRFGLRFCPRHEGEYAFDLTYADDTQSGGARGRFACTPSTTPGFLRVSETHDRHFVFEGNGEFFYHQGYNVFQLMQPIVGEENWKGALDYLDDNGFNKIRFMLLGGRSCDVYHYLLFPFLGTEPREDAQFDRYNLELWDHFDEVIRYMAERNMIASAVFAIDTERLTHLFAGWDSPTLDEYEYYRYAINRLGAFWNITWDLGNEHIEFHTRNWAHEMGAYVKEQDPYDHLLSAHAYRFYLYPEAEWSDYAILQAYPGGGSVEPPEELDWDHYWYVVHTSHYAEYPTPVVNDEYGFVGAWPADHVRKAHWGTTMCGSYASSGSFESLSVRKCRDCECGRCEGDCEPDHVFYTQWETVPLQLAHHKELFASLEFWHLDPAPQIIEEAEPRAFCRAKFPSEYLLYLPEGGSVTVDLEIAENLDLPVEWLNPITGDWIAGTPATTGGATVYHATSPFEEGDDAVLLIGRMQDNVPYADDFEEPSGDWKSAYGTWELIDGQYAVSATENGSARAMLPSHRFDDFRMQFDLRTFADTEWAGVHFRAEHPQHSVLDSGYLLTVYRSGWVNILEARDGKLELLKGGFQSAFDRRNANHVDIRAFGDFIDIRLNGSVIHRVKARESYRDGYVSLVSTGAPVSYDNLRIDPIQFEDFDDLDGSFVEPKLGDWKIDRDRMMRQRGKEARPRATLVDAPIGDFELSYRLQIGDGLDNAAAGVFLGSPNVPEYLGPLTGYLCLYAPAQSTLVVRKMEAGVTVDVQRVVVDGSDSAAGDRLSKHGMNSFEVTVRGNTITIANRGRVLLSYADPTTAQIEGIVSLMTAQAQGRFDDVLLIRDE